MVMNTECRIDGCDKPVKVKERGLCSAHYEKWRKHGDPLARAWDNYVKPPVPEEKRCARCNKVKNADQFYLHRKKHLSAYCKPCHRDYYAAKRYVERINRPPKPPKDPRPCAGPECDREGATRYKDEDGFLCPAHYNQKFRGIGLKPLVEVRSSYIDERFRKCTACGEVGTHDDFYNRVGGKGKQSHCKRCQVKTNTFNTLMRQDRLEEAGRLAESMPEPLRTKYMGKYLDAKKEAGFERSNGQ